MFTEHNHNPSESTSETDNVPEQTRLEIEILKELGFFEIIENEDSELSEEKRAAETQRIEEYYTENKCLPYFSKSITFNNQHRFTPDEALLAQAIKNKQNQSIISTLVEMGVINDEKLIEKEYANNNKNISGLLLKNTLVRIQELVTSNPLSPEQSNWETYQNKLLAPFKKILNLINNPAKLTREELPAAYQNLPETELHQLETKVRLKSLIRIENHDEIKQSTLDDNYQHPIFLTSYPTTIFAILSMHLEHTLSYIKNAEDISDLNARITDSIAKQTFDTTPKPQQTTENEDLIYAVARTEAKNIIAQTMKILVESEVIKKDLPLLSSYKAFIEESLLLAANHDTNNLALKAKTIQDTIENLGKNNYFDLNNYEYPDAFEKMTPAQKQSIKNATGKLLEDLFASSFDKDTSIQTKLVNEFFTADDAEIIKIIFKQAQIAEIFNINGRPFPLLYISAYFDAINFDDENASPTSKAACVDALRHYLLPPKILAPTNTTNATMKPSTSPALTWGIRMALMAGGAYAAIISAPTLAAVTGLAFLATTPALIGFALLGAVMGALITKYAALPLIHRYFSPSVAGVKPTAAAAPTTNVVLDNAKAFTPSAIVPQRHQAATITKAAGSSAVEPTQAFSLRI